IKFNNNAFLYISGLPSLSLGSCMADFSWASGGPQPVGAETTNRTAEKTASLFSSPPTTLLAARPGNDTAHGHPIGAFTVWLLP
ncbi:hypothetical protein PENTCL1PPCAC_9675, partial [Pristionchus entomophagus]